MSDPLSLASVAFPVVSLLGVILAVAEMLFTFRDMPGEALGNRWAAFLIAVNAGAAAAVLGLVKGLSGVDYSYSVVLAVGFGFPVLVRTRFTVIKQLPAASDGEGLGVNIGSVYGALQKLCRTQIDYILVAKRDELIRRLLEVGMGVDTLAGHAKSAITNRATLTAQEKADRTQYIDQVCSSAMTDAAKCKLLATSILADGGKMFLLGLIR